MQGAMDPPFMQSMAMWLLFSTATIKLAIYQFFTMIVPVILMYQLPRECYKLIVSLI